MSGSDALFYSCGCAAAGPVRPARGSGVTGAIDMHCHLVTPAVTALVADRPEIASMAKAMPALMGAVSFARNLALDRTAEARLADPRARIADMDPMGVEMQVVSPAPTQYHYWAEAPLAERLVAAQNEHLADLVASFPGRFLALGAVAPQHPDLAERQLVELMGRASRASRSRPASDTRTVGPGLRAVLGGGGHDQRGGVHPSAGIVARCPARRR